MIDASNLRHPVVYAEGPIAASRWKQILTSLYDQDRTGAQVFLARILRTRKRGIPIALNGRAEIVPRAEVRDFLRELFQVSDGSGRTPLEG